MKKRFLAVALCLLILLTACGKTASEQSPTEAAAAPTDPSAPADPAAPTDPSEPADPATPTEPENLSDHQKLYKYITLNSNRKDGRNELLFPKETYTFAMIAESDGSILWEYRNENSTVSIRMEEGNTSHAVSITLSSYTGTATLDPATYSDTERELTDFRTGASAETAAPLRSTIISGAWICVVNASTQIIPAGVTMAGLGFTSYDT